MVLRNEQKQVYREWKLEGIFKLLNLSEPGCAKAGQR